jgi:hypothetical protein
MMERTPRSGRALAFASAVFGASWLGWRIVASFSGAPLWLAVTTLAVEVVGFAAFGLLVWALWPDRVAAGPTRETSGSVAAGSAAGSEVSVPDVSVVVRCGSSPIDAIRGTVLAARPLGFVLLLDDSTSGRTDLAEVATGDGVQVHRPAADEAIDPLVSAARVATTDALVLIDAGQVPAIDLVRRLLPWLEPDTAVVQGAVLSVDGPGVDGPGVDGRRATEHRAPFAHELSVGLGARGVASLQGGGALLRRTAIAALDDRAVPLSPTAPMGHQRLTLGLFAAGWRIVGSGETVVAATALLTPPTVESVGSPSDPVVAERRRADEACAARLGAAAALTRRATPHLTPTQRGALLATAVLPLAGIRRSVLVFVIVGSLLEGSLPFRPALGPLVGLWLPWFALSSVALWRMSGGVMRPGDRSREATARLGTSWRGLTAPNGEPVTVRSAVGMLFGLDHGAAVATMVVGVSVVVGLRGLSDRLTHTLQPLTVADTVLLLVAALWVLAAGLSTLRLLTVRPLPHRTTRLTTSFTSTFAGAPARVVDITPHGAAVIGPLQVDEGDWGQLELVLPTATGCVSARIDVVVRYVRSSWRADLGGHRRAGVEFVALPTHVRDALIEFCMVQPALAALAGSGSVPDPESATPLAVEAESRMPSRRAGLRIAVVVALVGAVASSLTPSADAAAGVTTRVTGSITGDPVPGDAVTVLAIVAATSPRTAADDAAGSSLVGPVVTVVCASDPGGDDQFGTSDDIVVAPRSVVADSTGRFSVELPPELGTRLDGGRAAVSAGVACWRSVTPSASMTAGALAVRDRVWHDVDLDGSIDPDEPAVADAVVTLLRADSAGPPVAVRRVRTDWAGRFEFAALPVGDYAVAVSDLPSGLVPADVLGRSAVFHLGAGAGVEVPGLALVDASVRMASERSPDGGVVRWLPAVRSADLAPDQRRAQPAVRWLVLVMTLLLAMPLLAGLVTAPTRTRRQRDGSGSEMHRPDGELLRLPISLDRRPRHLWR